MKVLYSYTIKTKIILLTVKKFKQSLGRSREFLPELQTENNSNLELTVVHHKNSRFNIFSVEEPVIYVTISMLLLQL